MLTTLLLVSAVMGVGLAGASLLDRSTTILVDQTGSGDFVTIGEAVAVAEDGDTIRVRPGVYVEAVTVEQDVSIAGDGPRESIVIEAPDDGPTYPTGVFAGNQADTSYAMLILGSHSTVSGLTFRGESARVHARGGAPTLEDLVFAEVGVAPRGEYVPQALIVTGGTTATIRDSAFVGGGGIQVYDGSQPVIEGNELSGGPHIVGWFGDASIIRANRVSDTFTNAILVVEPTTALIEGNVISDSAADGIRVGSSSRAEGIDPTIRANTIRLAQGDAIKVVGGARPLITDNILSENAVAIGISRSEPRVEGNELRGNTDGIVLIAASPVLEDNVISEGDRGVVLNGAGSLPVLVGNDVCDNTTNLQLVAGAEPPARPAT